MNMETLRDLYVKELHELYGAEQLLVKELPKLADKAELPELRQAIESHLEETRKHVSRLEQVFQSQNDKKGTKKSKALDGILAEVAEDLPRQAGPLVRDAAIIAGCQQVEHWEISMYGTLHSYATHLGLQESADLLQQTLDEEHAADRKLTEIAVKRVNTEASRAA